MKEPWTLPTPCSDRVHTGLDQKIPAEHRVHIPRPKPRPKTLKRGFGEKALKSQKTASYDLKSTKRDERSYEWPEALYPLREWLRKHGVDVGALKSERQALWLAIRLGRQGKKMPHRLAPLFPALLKVQRTLCPTKAGQTWKTQPESNQFGTFGPASPVRSVSIAAYLAEKAAAHGSRDG